MKIKHLFWIVAAAGVVLWAGCQKGKPPSAGSEPLKKEDRKVEYWTCSMHPQIRADKSGNCPICGMTLVPVHAAGPASSEAMPGDSKAITLTEEGIRQAGVALEKAEKRKLTKELLIFGTLGYNLNLHRDVVPLVSGRIQRQFIDFNQTEVKKDEPLVSLYSPEALTLQEEYLNALRDRWLSTFYERELLSSMIERAKEKLLRLGYSEKHLARLEEEKEPTGEFIVRSPISGSIVGNMVHIGEFVEANTKLYHIVPLDELWFNAQVFEPDIGLLKLGEKVRITTKSRPGEEFIGKLVFIDRTLDVANRTVSVRFIVPNKDRRLLPNLSASGSLEIPVGDVLSVPNSAVLDLGTRHVVYVQKQKGAYLQQEVHIGQVTQHYTQILDGVSAGDEVVTSGAFLIDAQSQLRAGFVGHEHGGQKEQTGQPEEPMAPAVPPGHQH